MGSGAGDGIRTRDILLGKGTVGATSAVPGRRRGRLDFRITGDTMLGMETVTIRDLRNHGGDVVDRVEAGERVTVTRDGRPVAELRPVRSRGVPSAILLERWRQLPAVDADVLRREMDAIIDQSL